MASLPQWIEGARPRTLPAALAPVLVGTASAHALGRSNLGLALLALVVALAFQPLRSWVVRVADRLAYGTAAAPYEALTDFSRRLGSSPDPASLLPAVAEARERRPSGASRGAAAPAALAVASPAARRSG